jgi:hypothetical protein
MISRLKAKPKQVQEAPPSELIPYLIMNLHIGTYGQEIIKKTRLLSISFPEMSEIIVNIEKVHSALEIWSSSFSRKTSKDF